MTVTPIFQLLFYALETLPSNWISPFDYQSFIYFRAVSHINILFKSVTCHRFLLSPLLEPVYGVTPVTRVFCILRHLCHPYDTKKVFYIICRRLSLLFIFLLICWNSPMPCESTIIVIRSFYRHDS